DHALHDGNRYALGAPLLSRELPERHAGLGPVEDAGRGATRLHLRLPAPCGARGADGLSRGATALMDTAKASAPYVEIRGLVKWFGDDRAVDGVSFTVAKGAFVTLLGPSGCGKTTTLMSIAGLHRIDAGSIAVGDVVY